MRLHDLYLSLGIRPRNRLFLGKFFFDLNAVEFWFLAFVVGYLEIPYFKLGFARLFPGLPKNKG